MVADPLTKSEADDEEVLQRLMISNRHCIHASPEQQQAKKRKALLRTDLKKARKGDSRSGRTAPSASEANEADGAMDP